MLIDQISFWGKISVSLAVHIWRLFNYFSPSDPLAIKGKYFDRYEKDLRLLRQDIDELKKSEDSSSKPDEIKRACERAAEAGSRHYYRAKVLWGRPGRRSELACAWSYAISAEFYKLASQMENAAHLFHWAAHQFRYVGEPGASWDYYKKSADLAGKGSNLRLRSIRRAQGVGQSIGEKLSTEILLEIEDSK